MGKINLDNYEAYFLDLMEGNLAEDDRRELAVFLNMHPELKAELEDDFGDVTLVPETTAFEAKEELKATEENLPISKENIEDLIIAHIEGQLNAKQNTAVLEFVHVHKMDRTLAAYEATILSANHSETFTNKEAIRSGVIAVLTESINEETIEDFMIGYHEDTLSGSERMAVESYVKSNSLENELAAFQLIRLEPNLEEVFQNKAALKKPTGFIIPLYARVASVAAIGLTIFGLAYDWNPDTTIIEGQESGNALYSAEDHEGQIFNKTKPVNNGQSNDTYVYDGSDDNDYKVDEPKNNGPAIIPVDEQIVENENIGPELNPVGLDTMKVDSIPVIPNDINEIDDNIVIEEHPNQPSLDSIITHPIETDVVYSEAVAEIKRDEPIKVFTNLASRVFRRDVSMTRDKDVASDETVAYGFKLGRFEFSRKKSR